MKKITSTLVVGAVMLLMLALTTPAFAEEETITGKGECAKCALHETDKCQNVVEVEKDGKTVKYYLTGKVSTAFHHDNLCQSSHKVTATGEVKEKDGKMTMKVTKIELAE